MTDYPGLVRTLKDGGVDFIIVGGFAGVAHGSARQTNDLDVVYRTQNIENSCRFVVKDRNGRANILE